MGNAALLAKTADHKVMGVGVGIYPPMSLALLETRKLKFVSLPVFLAQTAFGWRKTLPSPARTGKLPRQR